MRSFSELGFKVRYLPLQLIKFFLIASFYDGRMKPRGFSDLLDEFPVDWVAVDHNIPSVANPVDLLRNAGWSPHVRLGRYELWRPNLADGIHQAPLR